MKKKSTIIIFLVMIFLIIFLIIKLLYFSTNLVNPHNNCYSKDYYINNTENSITVFESKTEFIRTFFVDTKLKYKNSSEEYGYIVVNQFQMDMPTVMKIKIELLKSVEIGSYYEFTFSGIKKNQNYSTIYDIINNFDLIKIDKTNKIGIEQRQDIIK